MLTDKKIFGKIEVIEARYSAQRYQKVTNIPVEICETLKHFRQIPGPDSGLEWFPASPGTEWGGNGVTAWFRGEIDLPPLCTGRKVFVWSSTGAEALFVVDGEYRGVFDENHPVVMMTGRGVTDHKYSVGFEAYSGHSFPGMHPHDEPVLVMPKSKIFGGAEILIEREDVTAFVFDLKVLKDVVNALDENSLRCNSIMKALAQVYSIVDAIPTETDESTWRPKLAVARKVMQPLLKAKNGSTAPKIGIIGHSHLDTAWLWPLKETRRKCARTYSSILNLMEQYPEFTFIQSSPCHTEQIIREYPSIFERIKFRVEEGRYEPNGGMWVEADCNIPSGESLVRQLLVGQAATREWFDYTSNVLWLPDSFGFSASLPQILQGCGIHYLCTTKIQWNDTTRFPYDTFIWKGIDGTSIIAHFHFLHCWPDPLTLTNQFNWIQHKDVQDRMLCAYGFGDGGGGPTAEMIEVSRRVTDLEGSPKAQHTTVSKFMDGIRDDLGPDLPVWSGELYLEAHRGTLTSISEIKRGNRKAELALRDAEFLNTLATLKGAEYPSAHLFDIWKRLLTNQFHDILAGSSIAEVNDLAVNTFKECITDARRLSESAVDFLAGKGDGPTLFLVNTLSWERSGEIDLNSLPPGIIPQGDGIQCQRIGCPNGENKLVVSGIQVPALTAIAVKLIEGGAGGPSPFTVTMDTVDTPFATVTFDTIGRMVSFVDKASGREIVKQGGALNSFLVGDDIPEKWDNWDIDRDQYLKMKLHDSLIKRETAAQGPLQLRIRSEYKIANRSSVIQDMVFHAHTPRVDFETLIDWADSHKLLKAAFELDILADFSRHDIPYGHIERTTHQNLPQDRTRFEVAVHKWTDISENGFGVALLNDSKYGIGVMENELRLTLIKSGTHPDNRGDHGKHHFTYSLLPHTCGFSVESVVRPSYELNIPVVQYPAGPEASPIPGILSVDAPNIIVESIKWAEKGHAFVVRLYEAGKVGSRARIKFSIPLVSVSETNLLEGNPKPLESENGELHLFFRPFQIKTLYCKPPISKQERKSYFRPQPEHFLNDFKQSIPIGDKY
jgi:alpha-mannosidase